MALDLSFGVTVSDEEFSERFLVLHKQLFASAEQEFNDVTTHIFTPPDGMFQVDHSFFHDGTNWHLYYVTGDMTLSDVHTSAMARGEWDVAAKNTVEPGMGHAVGRTLFELKYKDMISPVMQGDFDYITRSNGWVFRHDGRYGMMYGVRGKEGFVGFSLMWSEDLETWTPGDGNPIFGPPDWAPKGSTCKDVHVIAHNGLFLLYYITTDHDGYCCIALKSTSDWKRFDDHGVAFRSAPMMRGTLGIESPLVIHRDGLWHLFFTYGIGLWHAVSPNPRSFVFPRKYSFNVASGFYLMGPFHATELVQGLDGEYWLTTDRKEETRALNRKAGRLCFRGSYEDEKTLEEGLYLSRVRGEGDLPILEMPSAG